MTKTNLLLEKYSLQLQKALGHLDYTYKKIKKQSLTTEVDKLTEDQLETWESLSARFSRVVDIFLTKYLRHKVLHDFPGLDGSMRDFLNAAEKIKIITDVEFWVSMKELRNIIEHEYAEDSLKVYFENLKKFAPQVLDVEKCLKKSD